MHEPRVHRLDIAQAAASKRRRPRFSACTEPSSHIHLRAFHEPKAVLKSPISAISAVFMQVNNILYEAGQFSHLRSLHQTLR